GIAVPTLVSTLAISCVFTSVFFLAAPANFLFTPLGLAVVFAMLASYGLSRTLTPVMIGLLLKGERHADTGDSGGWFAHLHRGFERGFERLREGYVDVLKLLLARRFIVPMAAVLIVALGAVMLPLTGRDFFPAIDGGQIKLHVRAPAGTRIEATEGVFQAVDRLPTWSPKSSISDCRRRSTSGPSAGIARPTCASRRSCGGVLPQFLASSTRIFNRRSTARHSWPRPILPVLGTSA